MSHEASTGGSSRGKELERTEGNGPAMKGHGPGTAGRVAGEVRELGPRTFTHAVPTFWAWFSFGCHGSSLRSYFRYPGRRST